MEMTTQFSVLVENEPGALAAVCRTLAKAKVNILAISVLESAEHGIVRLVVDNPKAGARAITASGRLHTESEVFLLRLAHKPGVLAQVAERLAEKGLNIKYVYGGAEAEGTYAFLVLATEKMEEAEKLLADL